MAMWTTMENNVFNVQVVPYTECALGMEPQPFTSSVLAPKLFVEKVCSQGKKVSDDDNDNHFSEYDEDKDDAAGDPPCENAPRVQERDEAELCYALGDGRRWQTGRPKSR